jgi:hypothetical protein
MSLWLFACEFRTEIWKIIAVKRVSLQHRWCRKPMKYLKHELTMKKTIINYDSRDSRTVCGVVCGKLLAG